MRKSRYKYELQKGSKHTFCPACKKKTFKPYVRTGTDVIVDSKLFGRCERINFCRYHRYPDTNEDWTPPPFVYTPPKEPDFIDVYKRQGMKSAINEASIKGIHIEYRTIF